MAARGLLGYERLVYETVEGNKRTLCFDDGDFAQAVIHITALDGGGYHVSLFEELNSGYVNMASGDVTLTEDGQAIVNGVLDGPLRDRYEDGFDIGPDEYLHLL